MEVLALNLENRERGCCSPEEEVGQLETTQDHIQGELGQSGAPPIFSRVT